MKTKTIPALILSCFFFITSCENEGRDEHKPLEISGVEININSAELAIGDTITLKATILPYNAGPESIEWEDEMKETVFWKTANPSIVSVTQDGLVKAIGKGSCKVSFICGTYAAECSVTVRDFSIESFYGQWQSDNEHSYFFNYDGTGTADENPIYWTFDGMRLSFKSAGTSNTFVVVSTDPGQFTYYESNDSGKVNHRMKMAARPITADDLTHGITQITGKDGQNYDTVDLGLGVLWSTCNLMAQTPDQNGSFYAWGETGTKDQYTLDNYKWYDTDSLKLTKYVEQPTTLERADDAASAIMGGNWRTPTREEIQALCQNCISMWCKLGNSDGLLFISAVEGYQGNSVFLPLAGLKENYYGSIAATMNTIGVYWSSTLSTEDSFSAYYMQLFNMPESDLYKAVYFNSTAKRYSGACIRPVVNKE
ncbi:MAG: Ig-like domain-containing protein [Bacteroidaceae bacterium]|nr:Ig-like domain-containing protein [Bacteroidaceae bacterium]